MNARLQRLNVRYVALAVLLAGCGGSTVKTTTISRQQPNAHEKAPQKCGISLPCTAKLGALGSPTPACTTTVAVNGNVDAAFTGAANQVICLANGTWNQIPLSSSHTSANIVLRAQTPGSVTISGSSGTSMIISGQLSNTTIEGLIMTGNFALLNGLASDVFQYNTIHNYGCIGDCGAMGSAFYSYPGTIGGGGATNVSVLYNQVDHVPQFMEGDGNQGNWTISHNVVGPDIGNGGAAGHYIQTSSSGDVIDNNAFIGPTDPNIKLCTANSGDGNIAPHENVLHYPRSSSNDEFKNNILWHTDACGQTVLFDDCTPSLCRFDNLNLSNNLIVEDSTARGTYSLFVSVRTHGLTANNNTIDHAGLVDDNLLLTNDTDSGYASGTNHTITNNISVNHGSTNNDYSLGNCSTSCTTNPNVSSDTSAGGTGSITSWTPSWQSTTWTPTNGSPWSSPPSNYYKPSGIASTFGYQGTIGP